MKKGILKKALALATAVTMTLGGFGTVASAAAGDGDLTSLYIKGVSANLGTAAAAIPDTKAKVLGTITLSEKQAQNVMLSDLDIFPGAVRTVKYSFVANDLDATVAGAGAVAVWPTEGKTFEDGNVILVESVGTASADASYYGIKVTVSQKYSILEDLTVGGKNAILSSPNHTSAADANWSSLFLTTDQAKDAAVAATGLISKTTGEDLGKASPPTAKFALLAAGAAIPPSPTYETWATVAASAAVTGGTLADGQILLVKAADAGDTDVSYYKVLIRVGYAVEDDAQTDPLSEQSTPGEGTESEADNEILDTIYTVLLPTRVELAVDPAGAATSLIDGQGGQIASPNYWMMNQSMADVLVKVKGEFKPKMTGEDPEAFLVSTVEDLGDQTLENVEKTLQLGIIGPEVVVDDVNDINGGASTVALTSKRVYGKYEEENPASIRYFGTEEDDILNSSFLLKKATGQSGVTYGTLEQFVPSAIGTEGATAFKFYGNVNTFANWKKADFKVKMTYTFHGIPSKIFDNAVISYNTVAMEYPAYQGPAYNDIVFMPLSAAKVTSPGTFKLPLSFPRSMNLSNEIDKVFIFEQEAAAKDCTVTAGAITLITGGADATEALITTAANVDGMEYVEIGLTFKDVTKEPYMFTVIFN